MVRIGSNNWVRELRSRTEVLSPDFWVDFKPATEAELRHLENRTGRTLDPEFREFYRAIGYGKFLEAGYLGGFDSPEEILDCLPSPIFFITGSMSPGDEWASLNQHIELWTSRGRINPDPKRFTEDVLTLEGVKLYDLLQFGSNGGCCYHQLYVDPEPAPLRYCLLTDCQGMEDSAMTFSEGIEMIVRDYTENY